MAVKDQVGGESNVRFVEIHNRPVTELMAELKGLYGLNTNMIPMSRADGSPKNGLMLFVPHALLGPILKTIEALDTTTPVMIVPVARRSPTDLADLLTIQYPELSITAFTTPSALLLRGSARRLADAKRLIEQLDTTGFIRMFTLQVAPPAEVMASLQLMFPGVLFVAIADNQLVYARAGNEATMAQIESAVKALDALDVEMIEIMKADDDGISDVLRPAFPSLLIEYQHQGPMHTYMVLKGARNLIAQAKELIKRMENIDAHIVRLAYRTPLEISNQIAIIYQDLSIGLFPVAGINAIGFIATPEKAKLVKDLIRTLDTPATIAYYQLKYMSTADLLPAITATVTNVITTEITSPVVYGNTWMIFTGDRGPVQDAVNVATMLDTVTPTIILSPKIQTSAQMTTTLLAAIPNLRVLAFTGTAGGDYILVTGSQSLIREAKKIFAEIDTELPTRIFRSSYLHTQPDLLNVITSLFRDIRTISLGTSAGGGFEMVLATGPQSRLDELARFWATVDTPGRMVPYWPVNRPLADLLTPLGELMPHVGRIAVASATGIAPDVVMLYGDAPRVEEALDFLRKIDVAGDVKLLAYGRLAAADASALVAAYFPAITLQSLSNGSILAVAGNKQVLQAAEKLLSEIENGLHWRIVPLIRMTAVQAEALVTDLFGSVRVTQLPAGNGVVLVGTEVNLAEAIDMLRRIDQREVTLIPIKEADLATLAQAATAFFPEAQISQMATINSLAISADTAMVAAIRKFIESVDKERHTAIRPLKYYDPTTSGELGELTTTLQSYLSADGTIFFDRQSNAYVMSDGIAKLEKALKVLDDLDRAPPQFIIEAVIAEVSISDAKNLGFSWSYRPDLTAVGLAPPALLTIPASGGSNADFGGSGTFTLGLARDNLQATLSALLSKNDARIVATPKIVTRNNVTGEVRLQQSFPVTTTNPGTATTAPSTTVTFQPVPTTLRVTPSSSWNSDAIRMTVAADISVPGAATTTGAVPVSSRIVNTTVDMRDGQTLIIGGLMQKNKTEAVSKIPILGDIPGIGNIFKSTTTGEENREVLIFLSPRVIYPQTHDLQMEEELNRYKYLVNFPVDWSGRRWLINNQQRSPGLRQQMNQGSNFILQPPGTPAPSTPPPPAPVVPPAEGRSSMAPATTSMPPSYIAPMIAPSAPAPQPTYTPAPQPVSEPAFLGGVTTTWNINTATAAELKMIPDMPPHVAQLIVAYRNANGSFQTLNDLLNVPGMTPDILERSRKYLRMTSETTMVAPTPPAANMPPAPMTITPMASSNLVNINTAGVAELMTLPGLTEANARMILAYRGTYGSFSTPDQLIDVPGITPTMYGAIRDRVTVSSAPPPSYAPQPSYTPQPSAMPSAYSQPMSGPVNINTADEVALMQIGFSEQNAKLIVAWRSSYGFFTSIDELLDVPSITSDILDPIRPWLTIGGGSAPAAPAPAPSSYTPPAPSGNLVNVNTADEVTLMQLGLSEQNAKLIVAWRNSYGPFNTLEELLDVPSITQEIFDRVRNRLTLR